MSDDYVDPMISNFLGYMEIQKGCSQNTIKGYKHDLQSLVEYLVENKVIPRNQPVHWNQVLKIHLNGFLTYLYTVRNNKASSIHRRVCSLKGFFKFLNENEVVSKDPAKDLAYPKRAKSLPKFLPAEEIKTLLETAQSKATSKKNSILHSTIIEVLYSTGARCNEVRNMNLDDINIVHQEVVDESGQTRKTVAGGQIMIRGGKGNKDRLVLLTPRAAKVLHSYMEGERQRILKKKAGTITSDARNALFLSNRGRRVSNRTIQHFISEMSKEAGVRHTTPHMIRHSFASHLVMNKTNIRAIQQLLGHSSLDTTQIYANITPEFLMSEFEGNLPINDIENPAGNGDRVAKDST